MQACSAFFACTMPKKNSPADSPDASGLFGGEPAGTQSTLPLPATYEAAVQELEGLIARIESGQLPLDQLLSGYQRGAQLLQFCRGRLDAVEQQIRVLDGGELAPWNGNGDASA
ncbi:MAG: Exodeoxyribonuclease 7 small subunit [Paracidovorax wautersii]|uniref:Exodeoxyribonuclease 7 small subunit n=1 Tax=Paracidovorax wautersii TaxID=1177982 RepID=A0A7V8FQJ7_9BURK|nr:MAG: Exodeoxyribonuclease 7 small subunit [Paracidovorax wautersii]